MKKDKDNIAYVTGCLGFIGSHFTRRLLSQGWKVFGLDKETYAADKRLLEEFGTNKNFIYEKVDIKDLEYLCDCDYVFNFAAESHVGNSISGSKNFISSNVAGVQNLLELIRNKPQNCGPRPVFVQISTDEVYGDIDEGSHVETDLLKPSNPYSASKAAADMLVLAWARTYDVKYLIFRPTNNYGLNQYPEKLIPLAVRNLKRDRKIMLHNEGTPIRSWLHVQDTVGAIMSIINKNLENEIFNIAGGFEQTNSETVRKIITHYYDIGDEGEAWLDYVDFSYSRAGQDVRYSLNDKKLRSRGWKPTKLFDNEINFLVRAYKQDFRW